MTLTAASSRLTREAALEALTVVGIQIATHQITCGVCHQAEAAKKQRATNWALWVKCEQHRAFLRTQSALRHRLMYLRQQAVRAAAREAGMTVGEFMRKHSDTYRAIVREYAIDE